MKILNTMKVKFLVTLLAFILAGGPALFAASAAKQLEKGKELYAQNKDEEAMEYLIEVLVNGSRTQADEANQYINLIHSRMGGIQDPIEVDVNFKEGVEQRLEPGQDPAVLQAQLEAEAAAIEEEVEEAAEEVEEAVEEQAEAVVAQKAQAQADALALQAQLDEELAAQQKEQQKLQAALIAEAEEEDEEDEEAETEADEVAAVQTDEEDVAEEAATSTSTFNDLTSPSALRARQIYTNQKIDSMKTAVLARLEKTPGVRVYFRNGLPDAIDIDSEVLFNGYKFRSESLPVLDDVYALLALTQGAGYTILPPGSYTDNITLAGIRQAMALNSYLVHKGLSSGKLSYNMGLFDQEPPAKFANLDGVSIVFDFDAELPASVPEAASVNKLPMLSMAVVPVSNKIDPASGEAFVLDFSVIETVEPIDNWLFQIIQHADNGTYYVVRQLEGYAPVYHQVLWNGRKGVIGPELACGTYTLVLTATDVQGGKRTLRRQVEVACSQKSQSKATVKENLDYKTARLWTRPGRTMVNPVKEETPVVAEPEVEAPLADSLPAEPAAAAVPNVPANDYGVSDPYAATQHQVPAQGVNNPYDMPFEQY
ncbi:MAG: hypothetical protein IKL48_01475 [Elusimicrobiaceae bacterium]|nr:hypothetical protein [Elusimicrobiaceae bacterium]